MAWDKTVGFWEGLGLGLEGVEGCRARRWGWRLSVLGEGVRVFSGMRNYCSR